MTEGTKHVLISIGAGLLIVLGYICIGLGKLGPVSVSYGRKFIRTRKEADSASIVQSYGS